MHLCDVYACYDARTYSMHVCMQVLHTCIAGYLSMHACMNAHTSAYTCVFTSTFAHISTCMYVFTPIFREHACILEHTCVQTSIYPCMHTYAQQKMERCHRIGAILMVFDCQHFHPQRNNTLFSVGSSRGDGAIAR